MKGLWTWKKIRRLRVKLPALSMAVTAMGLVGVAMALVGIAVLAVTYVQKQHEQDALASEIVAARQSLAEVGDVADRQERLAIAESELVAERVAFPAQLSGPRTVGALIQLAEESGLTVHDVKTQPGREQQLGEHTYRALSIHVQVGGTLDALRNFVGDVEGGALQAARGDELSITMTEQPATDTPGESANGLSTGEVQHSLTASVDLSVYARD